jgi:hypothetical protein
MRELAVQYVCKKWVCAVFYIRCWSSGVLVLEILKAEFQNVLIVEQVFR